MYKWIMITLICAASILGLTALLTQGGTEDGTKEEEIVAEIPEAEPADVPAAEAVYAKSCLGCHGGNLEGGMGPALDKIGSTDSREKIYKQIVEGGGGMPKFEGQLKDEEILNLTNWLAEKK